ncbi:hypothetical protein [Archangium sp.]|uniref:hypothetical protein n=1 Tax=Archangium sp. TaxID=1872627 RepID=UPI00389A261E
MTRDQAIQEVLAKYPNWYSVPDVKGTCLYGPLVVESRGKRQFRFDMQVRVPWNFPEAHAHPSARILKHDLGVTLGQAAHVDSRGVLCVQMPERHEIHYHEEGLVGFIQQVWLHLDRARIWAFTGTYPGDAYAHGQTGREEYKREYMQGWEAIAARLPLPLRHLANPRLLLPEDRAWCPCRSEQRFKACHKPEVMRARHEVLALGDPPKQVRPIRSRNPFLRSRARRK